MSWLYGITDLVNLSLNGQTPGETGGQESLACCNPWGHKESDVTEQLNNDNTI